MTLACLSGSPCLLLREPTVSTGAWFDVKERVKQATDIVDLVGQYVHLERRGHVYWGRCPWHDDARPSFNVNPERQSFRCWVCNIGGDVFALVMRMEGVEFPEALAILAERAGISLHGSGGPAPAGAATARDRRRQLHGVMAWAQQCYHDELCKSPTAAVARDYFADRGITPQSIETFRLGFAPEAWSWLLDRGRAAGHSPELLEAAGLVSPRASSSGYYDRFRARALFSIRDSQARPVGLGGRVLPGLGPQDTAKYINSPETPLFSKSDLLYGLDTARESIRRTRTAIVVEGYTDCIVCHQQGFTNAVAVLGTALGPRHIRQLRGFADRIVLVLDGDEAGRRRTNEILELFVAQNVNLQILTLPGGLDPCDFLLGEGAARFEQLLSGAVDALEHKFRVVTESLGSGPVGLHASHEAIEDILATLARAPRLSSDTPTAARLKEEQILNRLARRFQVSELGLRQRLTDLRRPHARRTTSHQAESSRALAPRSTTTGTAPPDTASADRAAGSTLTAGTATGGTASAGTTAAGTTAAGTTADSSKAADWPNAAERQLLQMVIARPDCLPLVLQALPDKQLDAATAGLILAKCVELADTGRPVSYSRLMLEFEDPHVKHVLVELEEQAPVLDHSEHSIHLEQLLRRLRRRREQSQDRAGTAALEAARLDEAEQLRIYREIVERERMRQGISGPTDG